MDPAVIRRHFGVETAVRSETPQPEWLIDWPCDVMSLDSAVGGGDTIRKAVLIRHLSLCAGSQTNLSRKNFA